MFSSVATRRSWESKWSYGLLINKKKNRGLVKWWYSTAFPCCSCFFFFFCMTYNNLSCVPSQLVMFAVDMHVPLYTEGLRTFRAMAPTCTMPLTFPVQQIVIVINNFELWILLLLCEPHHSSGLSCCSSSLHPFVGTAVCCMELLGLSFRPTVRSWYRGADRLRGFSISELIFVEHYHVAVVFQDTRRGKLLVCSVDTFTV
jgi:hypothetical protein